MTSADSTSDHKISALRSALRSAPPKKGVRSRSPLRAAVAQLLPDLIALRAKGYNGEELAGIMRDNGFVISVRTLNKYINEARAGSSRKRKKKAPPVAPKRTTAAQTPKIPAIAPRPKAEQRAKPIAVPPSLLATKPLAQTKRSAKEVLGHRFDDDL